MKTCAYSFRIAALLFLLHGLPTDNGVHAQCPYLCGDAGGSGTVTSADVVNCVHWAFGLLYGLEVACHDMDDYGGVTMRDLAIECAYVFEGQPFPIQCTPANGTYVPQPNSDFQVNYNYIFPPEDTLVRVTFYLEAHRPFQGLSVGHAVRVDSVAPLLVESSTEMASPYGFPATVIWNVSGWPIDTTAFCGGWADFLFDTNRTAGRYALGYIDIVAPPSSEYRRIWIEPLEYLQDTTVTGNYKPMVIDSAWDGWDLNMTPVIVDPPGDVNADRSATAADIIYLVNYTFKDGPSPRPLPVAGDQNCDESVTSSDVIELVNYIFKSGPSPCDIHTDCTVNWESWTCP